DGASVLWAHTQVGSHGRPVGRPYTTRLWGGADLRVCPGAYPNFSSVGIFRHALGFVEATLSCAEDAPAESKTVLFEAVNELGSEACRFEFAAADVGGLVARLPRQTIDKDVLQRDLLAFHTLNFGDLRDLARAIFQAG